MCDAGDDRVPEDCNYTGLKCTALQLQFDRKLQPQHGEMAPIKQNKQDKFSSDPSTQGSAAGFGHYPFVYYPALLPTRDKITNFLRDGMALVLDFCFGVGYEFLSFPQMSTASPGERSWQRVLLPGTACQGPSLTSVSSPGQQQPGLPVPCCLPSESLIITRKNISFNCTMSNDSSI